MFFIISGWDLPLRALLLLIGALYSNPNSYRKPDGFGAVAAKKARHLIAENVKIMQWEQLVANNCHRKGEILYRALVLHLSITGNLAQLLLEILTTHQALSMNAEAPYSLI